MKNNLDYTLDEFQEILEKTSSLIVNQYKNTQFQKGFHDFSQEKIESWFDEEIPMEGMNYEVLLEEIEKKVINTATGNLGENMYAYVMSGGNQISTVAELISSTVNQNVAKWHLAPAMTEIEKRVVNWAGKIINFSSNAGGIMLSGGSEANLAGLTVARNTFFKELEIDKKGLFGQKPFTIYCSKETHNCVDKSTILLGIGTEHLRKIETNSDFTIQIEALENKIKEDIKSGFKPFCLIGNAGTVNTGAIDDLAALSELARKYEMWFHVDGAYGGLASSLPSLKQEYVGIEEANSVALDFHKWLYQPFEAGCLLVNGWNILKETYYNKADYLDTKIGQGRRIEPTEHMFQLSRNTKAFKVWMSLKAYGFERFQKMIQKDIDLTHYLADLVVKSSDFELKSTSHLAVVCFKYTGDYESEKQIIDINERLIPALEADGRIFIAGTKLNGEFVIRACLINHRKEKRSVEYLLDVIREVAKKIDE